MTAEQFDAASPQERNEAVAEALGWTRETNNLGWSLFQETMSAPIIAGRNLPDWQGDDGLALGELLAPMQAPEWSWSVGYNLDGGEAPYCAIEHYFEDGDSEQFYETGKTLAHAICKAWLELKHE